MFQYFNIYCLSQLHQSLSALYLVADIDLDGSYLACELGGDVVLHLHGFHNDDGFAGCHFLTYADTHLLDGAGQGCIYGVGSPAPRSPRGGESLFCGRLSAGWGFSPPRGEAERGCWGACV